MTRVAYIGNFKHQWCTEVHLARDMRNLRLEVEEFQEPENHEDKFAWLRSFERSIMEGGFDVVMFTRTWGLPSEATQVWRRFEHHGIKTFSYHLDLYLGLRRHSVTVEAAEEKLRYDPFWTTQYVFTPDGDPKSAGRFKELGVNHHWLSPAVVSDECYIGKWDDRFDFDVVFVGSYGYHDEWPWRPRLIDYLAERYGDRFMRFHGDVAWPKDGHKWSDPEKTKERRPVRGKDLNNLYATARVVVGDSLCLPGHTNYWSDRYFETLGRGGALIAPMIPGLESFLTEDVHYWAYDHPDAGWTTEMALAQIGEQVDAALRDDAERARVQKAGHEHVKRHHTYRHRLAQAFEIMGFGRYVPMPDNNGVLHLPQQVLESSPHGYSSGDNKVLDALIEAMQHPVDPADVMWPNPPRGSVEFLPSPTLTIEMELTPAGEKWAREMMRIDKLELGSGFHPTPGFTTLDANAACNPDIVGTAWPLDLPDESVGELRCVDVLEHISYRHTAEVLADWFRVLEPGGRIYIQVPDADLIMHWYVEQPDRLLAKLDPVYTPYTPLFGAAWRILGGHNDGVYAKDDDSWMLNAHFAMFSPNSLRLAVEAAGFKVESLVGNDHPNLLCWAVKP